MNNYMYVFEKKKPFRGKVPYDRNKETNFAENRNTTFKI